MHLPVILCLFFGKIQNLPINGPVLRKSHVNEGIRDPIKAYEYMNKFYVEEGNKRVSVLKYYDAVSVPGLCYPYYSPKNRRKREQDLLRIYRFLRCF